MEPLDYSEGHKAYKHYMALKRHFTTKSFDFFKYNGQVKSAYDTFVTRNDAMIFQRIAKNPDYKNLILANMLENPKIWVGSLLDNESEEVYLVWKEKNKSLDFLFEHELSTLKDDYQSNFSFKKGGSPHLVALTMAKELTMETFSILSHMTKSYDFWEENGLDNIVFGSIIETSKKYHPFLQYDRKKFKGMIKNRFFPV